MTWQQRWIPVEGPLPCGSNNQLIITSETQKLKCIRAKCGEKERKRTCYGKGAEILVEKSWVELVAREKQEFHPGKLD